jgi:hypothetical protein
MKFSTLLPRFLAALPLILSVLALTIGCSPGEQLGQVNGVVTINGKPLNTGSILFQNSAAGVSINANIAEDGTFVVKTFDKNGIPPGIYKVVVRADTFGDPETPLVGQPIKPKPKPSAVVPEKYRTLETSDLSVTVNAGANPPLTLDLKP